MKKLLSLLSVLTISGTAVPTTIAASPYQKEETIKNSDINYSQTNNLETLNRNKRQNWGVSISTTFPTNDPVTKQPTGRQGQINIGLGNRRITEPQNYDHWGHNTNVNWTNKNTGQPGGFSFNFGENNPNTNHQNQQPTYQQPQWGQPTYQQPTYQQPQWSQPTYQQPQWGQPTYQQPTYQQPTYQQPTYQQPQWGQPTYQQPTFNPNAPSTVNTGRTQGQDLQEFSRGMQEIERLANQQSQNTDQTRLNQRSFRDRINERFPNNNYFKNN